MLHILALVACAGPQLESAPVSVPPTALLPAAAEGTAHEVFTPEIFRHVPQGAMGVAVHLSSPGSELRARAPGARQELQPFHRTQAEGGMPVVFFAVPRGASELTVVDGQTERAVYIEPYRVQLQSTGRSWALPTGMKRCQGGEAVIGRSLTVEAAGPDGARVSTVVTGRLNCPRIPEGETIDWRRSQFGPTRGWYEVDGDPKLARCIKGMVWEADDPFTDARRFEVEGGRTRYGSMGLARCAAVHARALDLMDGSMMLDVTTRVELPQVDRPPASILPAPPVVEVRTVAGKREMLQANSVGTVVWEKDVALQRPSRIEQALRGALGGWVLCDGSPELAGLDAVPIDGLACRLQGSSRPLQAAKDDPIWVGADLDVVLGGALSVNLENEVELKDLRVESVLASSSWTRGNPGRSDLVRTQEQPAVPLSSQGAFCTDWPQVKDQLSRLRQDLDALCGSGSKVSFVWNRDGRAVAPGTYRSLTDPAQHQCVMEVLEDVRLPKHTCLPKPIGL